MTALDAEQFLNEVDSFPIDIKTKLVDKLLHSLHALWRDEIELRVDEIKTGKVTLVDGEEVFARVRSKFQK